MVQMQKTKRIKILTRGVITSKNFVYGPVLTPYPETLQNIYKLLADGVNVVEVTDDGKDIPLDTMNYDKDHSKAARMKASEELQKKEFDTKKAQKADEAKAALEAKAAAEVHPEETNTDETNDSSVELAAAVIVERPNQQNNNNQHGKNKKNKKNNGQNYSVSVTPSSTDTVLRLTEETAVQK